MTGAFERAHQEAPHVLVVFRQDDLRHNAQDSSIRGRQATQIFGHTSGDK
jgi:hypothetical protein